MKKHQKRVSNKHASSILGGAVSLTVSAFTVKVLGLIYKIPISHVLTDEGMGYFNAAYTVYGFLYLLCTAGVPKAISILTTECDAQGKHGEKSKVLRVSLATFGVLGALLTVVFCMLAEPIGALIGSPEAFYCMLAIAPSLLFVSLSGVMRGYLSGHAHLLPIAISQVIEGVSKLVLGLILAYIAVRRGFDLPRVAGCTILGITIGSILSFVYLWFHVRHIQQSREHTAIPSATRSVHHILGDVVHVALPVTVSAGVMSISNMLDLTLIMKRLLSIGYTEAQATALYGNYTTLVIPMFNLAAAITAAIAMATLPHLTKHFVLKNEAQFRSIFLKTTQSTVCFVLPFSLGLMLFGKPVLALLFAEASAEIAAPLLSVLSPSIVLLGMLTVVNTALEAAGKPNAPLFSMLAGCAVKLPVSYILIGKEAYGILGAPIGTVLSYGVSLLVSLCLLSRTQRVRLSFLSCLVKPAINATGALLVTNLLFSTLKAYMTERSSILLCIAFGVVLYALLSLLTGTISLKKEKNPSI